jgi:prepilin peptidase CpaA
MLPQDIIVATVTLASALTDVRRGKVYNWLTYPAALIGLVLSFFFAPPDPWQSALGLGGALLMYGILRKVGSMGAGDVKLMAAIGALKGLPFVVFSSIYIILIAACTALVLLAWGGKLLPALRWMGTTMVSLVVPAVRPPASFEGGKAEMPFAPAIFIGTVWCLYLEAVRGPFAF